MTEKTRRIDMAFSLFATAALALAVPAAHGQERDAAKIPFIPEKVTEQKQKAIWDAAPEKPAATPKKKRRVLIFNTPPHIMAEYGNDVMKGDAHMGTPHGTYAFQALGVKSGAFEPVTAFEADALLPENLGGFDAVIFNSTPSAWITPSDKAMQNLKKYGDKAAVERLLKRSLLEYFENGGGIVGHHYVVAGNIDWYEHRWLWGGGFAGHPWTEEVGIKLPEPDHPLAAVFEGKDFRFFHDIYQYCDPYSREYLRPLLAMDPEKTDMSVKEKPGWVVRTDDDFALAWIRNSGKGRFFYCAFGDDGIMKSFLDPKMMRFQLDGIQFAMGDIEAPAEPAAWGPNAKFDLAAIKQRLAKAESPAKDSVIRSQCPRRFLDSERSLQKSAVLRAIADYAGKEAAPVFAEAMKDESVHVRMAAMWGLARTGDASHVLPLAEAALAAKTDDERESAREALIRLRGNGIEKAIADFAADKDKSPAIRAEMALALAERRALAERPPASQMEDMLGMTQKTENAEQKAAALACYIRLLGMRTDLSPEQACEAYKSAMPMAKRDEERKPIFAGIGNIPDPHALRTLEEIFETIEDESLRPVVEKAYINVAISLKESNKKDAKEALDMLCSASSDKELVERAKKHLKTLE